METFLNRDVQTMIHFFPSSGFRAVLVLMMAFWSLTGYSLVNPDKPDPVKAFRSRAEPYQKHIHEAETTKEFADAHAQYTQFLKKELQSAYKELISTLSNPERDTFKRSHEQWLEYRDTEFKFINKNWTLKQFGSSATLSRGSFRNRLLEDRVLTLLRYLQNY